MAFEIRPALRKKSKLRLGMSAPSGYGKTYSSLLIAQGLGGKIGLIDTEHGSGDLYADLLPEGYDVLPLTPPYTPARYIEAIHTLEQAGYDVIIVDSLSHAWAGEGGALDKQGKLADKTGNSYTAWRQVTPEHNKLVESILQSKCHMIVTLRAKTEYVQEKDERTGKNVVRKLGLAPIMRDGIEYEFTVFFELGPNHVAHASKDRTRIFADQFFTPDPSTGEKLLAWLETGVEDKAAPAADLQQAVHGLDVDEADRLENAISRANNMAALKAAFVDAYHYAQTLNDLEMEERFAKAKDTRKKELEGATA